VCIGLTLQQVEGWGGQFARVSRWRERVVAAANGEPSADELDFLLAFFESAYHLRDWLVETKAVSNVEVDGYVASNLSARTALFHNTLETHRGERGRAFEPRTRNAGYCIAALPTNLVFS
jgi:hypothetical protein